MYNRFYENILGMKKNEKSAWKVISKNNIQCSKKETFRPRRGPEFPPYDKKSNFLCVSVFLPQYNGAKQIWPTSIGKKFFAGFGAESFFFWALYILYF